MDLDGAIDLAISGRALLFTGAGFSKGAKNLLTDSVTGGAQDLLTGDEFARKLATELQVPDDFDLDVVAQIAIDRLGDSGLISRLQKEFTASSIAAHHRTLAGVNWRKVYTTNYDDVMEKSYSSIQRRLTPVTDSTTPQRVPKTSTVCVHLNGFIDRLDSDTLTGEFRLTSGSYAASAIRDSPWSSVLRQDIRAAEAVFFVGYSLYDLDIAEILVQDESIRRKTFFVLRSGTKSSSGYKAQRFGSVIEMSAEVLAERFSERLRVLEENDVTLDPPPVGMSVMPFRAPDQVSEFRDMDIANLLLLGEYKRDLAWDSLHSGIPYVFARTPSTQVMSALNSSDIVVLHGDMGNGKSLVLEEIRMIAFDSGMPSYALERPSEFARQELEQIASASGSTCLLTVDDYHQWLDECNYLGLLDTTNLKIVLSTRSATHDGLRERLVSFFPNRKITEVSANRLDDSEVDRFIELFDQHPFWGDERAASHDWKRSFVRVTCKGEMSALLFNLLSSPQIKTRLQDLLHGIGGNQRHYDIVVSLFVISALQVRSATTGTLMDFWEGDINDSRFRGNSSVKQLCDFSSGEIRLRSALAAEVILQTLVNPEITMRVITRMILISSRNRHQDRTHGLFYYMLMRYSKLAALFPKPIEAALIRRYYDGLRRSSAVFQDNHNFWLQYAVAALAVDDFGTSASAFRSARSLAKKYGASQHMIENHWAKYLLRSAIERQTPKDFMEPFREAKNIILRQTLERGRLYYPYRVASFILGFVEIYMTHMTSEQKLEVASVAATILDRARNVGPDLYDRRDLVTCRENMELVLMFLSE